MLWQKNKKYNHYTSRCEATLKCSLILILPLLAGCQMFYQDEAAPVYQAGGQGDRSRGSHIVKSGDSLYEIAWEYGMDYRELAKINHISSPYVIYPGQKLRLNATKHAKSLNKSIKASQPKTHFKIQSQTPKQTQAQTPSQTLKPALKSPLKPLSQPSKATLPKPADKEIIIDKAGSLAAKGDWQWPTQGKVTHGYSASTNKGIDIAGSAGTPVYAARGGKVVYSGSGLRGYGQLLIIKHNDTFLSAYAHNRRLLVKEGDSVKKGQMISEMGQTESDSVKLHFEIRKNGQPINPMSMLPKTG
ncbi:MAG: peptidoglycan DD-metalloendopeptidase family protein [Candidatus Berkiellales bacterium]